MRAYIQTGLPTDWPHDLLGGQLLRPDARLAVHGLASPDPLVHSNHDLPGGTVFVEMAHRGG